MDRSREHDLIRRAQAGDQEAMAELLRVHDRYIKMIANKYKSGAFIVGGWESLLQTAVLGFLKAVNRFDTSKYQNRLLTYATFWMKNEIDEEFSRSRSGPSVPRESDGLRRILINIQYELYQSLERWPSWQEVADRYNERFQNTKTSRVNAKFVQDLLVLTRTPKSLDAPLSEMKDDDEGTLHDSLPNPESADPLDVLIAREERLEAKINAIPTLVQAFSVLTPVQEEVIRRRYGFAPYGDNSDVAGMYVTKKTRGEMDYSLLPAPIIAKQMGLTTQGVTNVLRSALQRMAKAIKEV